MSQQSMARAHSLLEHNQIKEPSISTLFCPITLEGRRAPRMNLQVTFST